MSAFTHITTHGDNTFVFSKAGKFVVFLDNVSGRFTFELSAPDVDVQIFGAYQGRDNKVYSLSTIQHHKSPNTTSNLLVKGVFEDESQFNNKGLIRIEKDCNGSHAYQKNQNLVLSDKVHVKSEPDLEILSNEVFCTHGSTTGGPNEESLYYLMTRGLPYLKSRDLYVQGFLKEVHVKIEEGKRQL